jgi:hypothetical protein
LFSRPSDPQTPVATRTKTLAALLVRQALEQGLIEVDTAPARS